MVNRFVFAVALVLPWGLLPAQKVDAGAQCGLNSVDRREARAKQGDHTVASPDLMMALWRAGGLHPGIGGAEIEHRHSVRVVHDTF